MSISYMSWSPNFDKEISRASGKNGINRMECSTTYTVTMTLQSLHQLRSSRWAADIKDVCIIVSTTSSKKQSIMDSWILEGDQFWAAWSVVPTGGMPIILFRPSSPHSLLVVMALKQGTFNRPILGAGAIDCMH